MKRKTDALFAGAFLLLLLLPAVGLLRAEAPIEYGARDAYVEENLGFRAALITLHAGFHQAVLSQTGNPQVILGQEGWLYFADTLPDYGRRNTLPDAEIEQMAQSIADLSEALGRQGVGFTFLCAPNKNTVYPEFMPKGILPGEGPGNLERTQNALREKGVDVLDAAGLLRSRKAEGPLYLQTDTHWNARGALLVYRALMERLTAGRPHAAYDAYESPPEEMAPVLGDLAALYRPLAAVTEADPRPAIGRRYAADGPMRSLSDMMIRTRSGANDLRVLVLRDSFGEALFPYLANNVGRLLFIRTLALEEEAIAALVREEAIGHVVLEIAERSLTLLL